MREAARRPSKWRAPPAQRRNVRNLEERVSRLQVEENQRLVLCKMCLRDAFQIKNPFISGTCPNQGEGVSTGC